MSAGPCVRARKGEREPSGASARPLLLRRLLPKLAETAGKTSACTPTASATRMRPIYPATPLPRRPAAGLARP